MGEQILLSHIADGILLAYMTKQTRAKVRNYQPDELREIVDHVDGVYEKLAKLAGGWQESVKRGTENE